MPGLAASIEEWDKGCQAVVPRFAIVAAMKKTEKLGRVVGLHTQHTKQGLVITVLVFHTRVTLMRPNAVCRLSPCVCRHISLVFLFRDGKLVCALALFPRVTARAPDANRKVRASAHNRPARSFDTSLVCQRGCGSRAIAVTTAFESTLCTQRILLFWCQSHK